MLSYRLLPPSEYYKLGKLGWFAEGTTPLPNPDSAIVIVAENGDEIKGFWIARGVVHIEPVWTSEHKGLSLMLSNMYTALLQELQQRGVRLVYVFSAHREHDDMLQGLGFQEQAMKIFEGVLPCRPQQSLSQAQ